VPTVGVAPANCVGVLIGSAAIVDPFGKLLLFFWIAGFRPNRLRRQSNVSKF
jgi:hypothetical protein